MKKNLIIALAIVGLGATTACGKKDGYRAYLHSTKVEPPSVDPTVEQQALAILNKDSQFQTSKGTVTAASLQENVNAASISIDTVAQGSASQAQVSLMNDTTASTCVPAVTLSSEFNRSSLGVSKVLSFDGVGRAICVDAKCDNMILIVEKKDGPSDNITAVAGSVAILMSRDTADNVYKPMKTTSTEFQTAQRIEDSVVACQKALNPSAPSDDMANMTYDQKIARIQAIDKQLADIETQITQNTSDIEAAQQGSISVSLDTLAARQTDLNNQKKALTDEKAKLVASVGSTNVPLAPSSPIVNTPPTVDTSARDAQVKDIDVKITAIQSQIDSINSSLARGEVHVDDVAQQLSDLNKQKSDLEIQKAALYGHM